MLASFQMGFCCVARQSKDICKCLECKCDVVFYMKVQYVFRNCCKRDLLCFNCIACIIWVESCFWMDFFLVFHVFCKGEMVLWVIFLVVSHRYVCMLFGRRYFIRMGHECITSGAGLE